MRKNTVQKDDLGKGETHWREIIMRGIESDTLDYKSALDWKALPRHMKAKFVRHCIAFANTRGGMIVIGVSEDESGRPVLRTGLTPAEAAGFDPSAVGSFINSYVDPPVDITIHRPELDGKIFAVIEVKPFAALPHVCTKGIADELNAGVLYIRTVDASSRPAYRSGEIHDLLIRALRLQREQLGRLLKGLLYGIQGDTARSSGDLFEEQMLHGRNFYRRRKGCGGCEEIFVEVCIRPEEFEAKRFSINELRRAVGAMPESGEWYTTNTSLRYCAGDGGVFGQLSRSGLYQHIGRVTASAGGIRNFLQKAVTRGIATLRNAGLSKELLGISVALHPANWSESGEITVADEENNRNLSGFANELSAVTVWHSAVDWSLYKDEYTADLAVLLLDEFS